MDADLEKAEAKLSEAKLHQEEGEQSKTTNDNLQRKIQLMEEELDASEKNNKETVEKYVYSSCLPFPYFQMWGSCERVLTELLSICLVVSLHS